MDYMLKKYLPRIHFDSYEDFKTNYRVNVPADFNFGFDVVDGLGSRRARKKSAWSGATIAQRSAFLRFRRSAGSATRCVIIFVPSESARATASCSF